MLPSRPARPARRLAPLLVELLTGPDLLDGPTAAVVDLVRMMNALAATRGARRAPLAWRWRSPDGRVRRRTADAGSAGAAGAAASLIVVPGWNARSGAHLSRLVARDRASAMRLHAAHGAGAHVVALYTGSALLGEAGLLTGRSVVVPWPFIPSVLRHAPGAELVVGDAWTQSDRLWTADTPALATELTLRALAALATTPALQSLVDAARAVLVHAPERQRLVQTVADDSRARIGPGTLQRARRWLEEHLHEPFSLPLMAAAAGTSERSLLRHFRAAFDATPLQTAHALRVTRARMLLETTYLPLDSVAERCGWQDRAMLSRVFRRATGLTPAAYRERHRLRARRREWGQDLGP